MWPFLFILIALLGVLAVLADQIFHVEWMQIPAFFLTLPLSQQLLIGIVALMALYLIGFVVWQSVRLVRKTRDFENLNNRLDAARDAAELADETQRNLNSAVQHLVANDPESAIAALNKRVAAAELLAAAQQGRSVAVDVDERLGDIRRRQQALRQQLGEVTEARRTIAPVLDELRERQIQLDRALAEVERETDASGRSLADRIKVLDENVTHFNARLNGLQDSLATLNRFKEDLGQSMNRIVPLKAPDFGIEALLRALHGRHGELNKALDEIELQGEDKLSVRVETLARNKHETEQRMARLFESSALLEALRGAFDDLAERRTHLERSLAEIETDANGRSMADRQNELSEFTSQSRSRLLTLENSLNLLNRFKEDLDKYQSELVPLQSPVSGIEAVIGELHGRRDRLIKSLEELESDGGERLGARVEAIYRSKVETQQRIAEAVEHFAKLNSIRKEVEGLFAKLSFTVERLG